jgi:hypothetical protein
MNKQIGQCRDCQHWQTSKFQIKQLETCPKDLDIEEADVYAECKRIEKGLLVELLKIQKWDDSELDYIETSANFGCLFFKPQPL